MVKKYLKDFYWKDYLYITVGLCIYAIGLVGFIIPVKIVPGGLTGISLLIQYATDIPNENIYFAVNCVLLLSALKILGSKFLIKTVYGVVLLTLLVKVAKLIIKEPFVVDEPLLSGVIGGMVCGGGVGMVFSANGSTGGTDILIAIIAKYRNLSFGRGMQLFDFCIICSSYFVANGFQTIVYSLIVMGVMTYTIDIVMNGFRQSVQFLIFSPKYATIADAINNELHRGCTVLDGTGWYSKNPTKVIIVLAKQSESVNFFRLVKSIDENAFISQSTVRGVYGRGFDEIKT